MLQRSPATTLLTRIWADTGGDAAQLERVQEPRHPVPLPARTDVSALAWASTTAASLAGAAAADAPRVEVNAERVAVAYSSERHFAIDGQRQNAFAPLSGFFRTRDGWVRTHGNYPHHAAALRRTLALPSDADTATAAAAFARRGASEVSAAITDAGGICVTVRREGPAADAALHAQPLLKVTRVAASALTPPLTGHRDAPLRGIRVLDLTRVIAGPVGTRTLALLGADVLRIDPPGMPEIGWQHLDTGHGKRSALLDLARGADRRRFDDLLATADVVALGYRPTALDRFGLSPAALAHRRPGIIVIRHRAWADSAERGFDSVVQAATGIALIESVDGPTPGALPAQALDHSAGYLLATAAIMLLNRRAREGGSWLAETSLRRVAAELLTIPRTQAADEIGTEFDPAPHRQDFTVDGQRITTTAPAIGYDGAPGWFASPRPWGCDEPTWVDLG